MADEKGLVDLEQDLNEQLTGTKFKVSSKPETEEKTPRAPRQNSRSAKATSTAPPFKAGVIQSGVENTYAGLSFVWSMVDPVCGAAFLECAPAAAEAWEELAKSNPAVRAMLMRVFAGSATAKVIKAHIPLLMAVFMHHGMGRIQADHEKKMSEPVQNYPDDADWDKEFPQTVPNSGSGFTYQMPENPAMQVG